MTVVSELCAVERNWTGAETVFETGFVARDATDCIVSAGGTILTRGIHYTSSLNPNRTLKILPLPGMIAAPATLLIERNTPGTQENNLRNSDGWDMELLEEELDGSAMRDAETKRISRLAREAADEARDLAEQALNYAENFLLAQLPPGGIGNNLLRPGVAVENIGYIPENAALKNQPNGYAGLGANGQLSPSVQRAFAGSADVVATDDGEFDCSAALALAKSIAGPGGVLRFRKVTAGNYFFGASGGDFTGYILDVEEGVVLSGNVLINFGDIETKRTTQVKYNNAGTVYDYELARRPRMDHEPIKGFLDHGEIESGYIALPADPEPGLPNNPKNWQTGLLAKKLAWDTGNTWTADSAATPLYAAGTWSITTQTEAYAFLTPAFGRNGPREVSWFFGGVTSSNVDIGITVECAQGWKVLTVSGDGTTMTMRSRAAGGSTTSRTLPQTKGRAAGLDSWLPRQVNWGVVPLGPNAFAVLQNGVIIHRETTFDVGIILEIGPTVRATSAGTHNISVLGFCVEERTAIAGGGAIGLCDLGDSLTDITGGGSNPLRYPVQWVHYCKAWLDGSQGVRLTDYWNLAEAGASVINQRDAFRAFLALPESARCTHVSVHVGKNNIQSNTAYSTFFDALDDIIFDAQSRGIQVLLDVPDEFYSRTLAAAVTGEPLQGQNVTLYQVGAGIRQAVKQAALQYGCVLIDSQKIIGLELPAWLLNADGETITPSRLKDGIHGGLLYAAQKGYYVSKKLLQTLSPRVSRTLPRLPLPNNLMLSGFSTGGSLGISLLDGHTGVIEGDVIAATAGNWNGVSTLTVPRFLRPKFNKRVQVEDGNGLRGSGILYAATGILQIFSTSAGTAQFVSGRWMIDG